MEKPLLDTIPIGLSSSHIEAISKYSLPEITSVCILLLYSFSRFTTESIYYNYGFNIQRACCSTALL